MDNTPLLTTSLQALIDGEQERIANAAQRLGTIVPIAQGALAILSTSVVSINQNHGLIAAFMLAIQKSTTLAFLSYVRGHCAQAEFNCRQAIEFVALGSYLLANPEVGVFDDAESETPTLKNPKMVSSIAYKWLQEAEPELQ